MTRFQEVEKHANQILGWMEKRLWLFDIALNSLVLGRTLLLIGLKTENSSNYDKAKTYLDEAVKNLRNSNRLDYLPYSLIIRSILYRETKYLDKSKEDLTEALELAESGKMKIYQADAHLEFVRFYLANNEPDKACDSLEKAKCLINEMNYHRQDWRVEDLEKFCPKTEKDKETP